jgi:hypothetical protein
MADSQQTLDPNALFRKWKKKWNAVLFQYWNKHLHVEPTQLVRNFSVIFDNDNGTIHVM